MWRALLSRIFPSNGMLPNICTLQRQNCPPTFYQRSVQFASVPRLGGSFCLGRVFLRVEGGSGAYIACLCVHT